MKNCDGCPCLNNDYEYGGSCNLEYDCDLRWFNKNGLQVADTPEMRSHQKDFDLFYASKDCGLIKIVHSNGVFVPRSLEEQGIKVKEILK